MNKQAQATVKTSAPTMTPLKSTLLQRTCACGASAGIDDLCSECRDKRLTSPHGPQHASGLAITPPLVQHTPHSPAQAPTTGTNLFINPNIGYNFAQVRVHAPAPQGLQTKLTVNQPGDVYEQEADQVAEQVMRMVTPGTSTSPAAPGGDDEQEEESVMRKEGVSTSAQGTTSVPSIVGGVLSGGESQPLDTTTRALMEPRFGYDFSQVRIHTDARAAESAQAVNALAYTVRHNIVFGAGQFAPGTSEGQRLLAHELTHVVQQGKGTGGIIQRQGAPKSGTVSGEKGAIAKPASLPTSLPTSPTADADPCGGESKANTYTPSDKDSMGKEIPIPLTSKLFGDTSKLGAQFQFGACKVKGNWRFYLDTLTVPIASKVQPIDFRKNIDTANDPGVTQDTYKDIINDLRPDSYKKEKVKCSGNEYIDDVTTFSRRRVYWKQQLAVDHEAFHRSDWDKMYRPELVQAEKEVWGYSIPASDAATASAAITKAQKNLTQYMIDAIQRTCKAYTPKQESRAYDAGAPQYQKLVDDIVARAKKEKW